ncbi:NAD(+) diphosphatase [Pseudohoeflea suaedae]|uniref:NAD(+) diphosphatase n=1 Tax=Pseudohoeflea suaedae TaxID=877384 RepID=A0A4R5PLV7_9HYPH|nr:NAD(+) diphosphatase [Pseudohoeflea suaedae]TDH37940.1 NAD(+) diphosphatase [Pseudohoeflea suaedae]
MPSSIFDTSAPHGEASRLVAFSGNTIDRQSEFRSEDELPRAIAEETARYFAITGDRLIMRVEGKESPIGLLEKQQLASLEPEMEEAILLGRTEDGHPRLAVPCGIDPDRLPDDYMAIDARSVYRQMLMDQQTLGTYAQANSLVQWARSNRHCGRCGSAMVPEAGGYRRKCGACGHTVFPRTDPVVIMMVIDETNRRCLMGRSPHFPEGMYSCLAGFVEPGETIEDAVRRETFEESGIRVGRVRYHASQPWPIPHSLMIGMIGEALDDKITYDSRELEDCRWFSVEETEAMLASSLGEAGRTPPPGAIAHRLMRDWIDWPQAG